MMMVIWTCISKKTGYLLGIHDEIFTDKTDKMFTKYTARGYVWGIDVSGTVNCSR